MNEVAHPQPLDVYWQQQVEAWKLTGLSQRRIKGLWGKIFFQYPDALHELN